VRKVQTKTKVQYEKPSTKMSIDNQNPVRKIQSVKKSQPIGQKNLRKKGNSQAVAKAE
jgi:hypothetical protein